MSAMTLRLREAQRADLPFMYEMLYEGVFWRESRSSPSFEEGLALPEVKRELAHWGERDGDTAVIAILGSVPVGAAWYRFWPGAESPGYVDERTPVLAIAVHRDHRGQGVGTRMLEWLIRRASEDAIPAISLSVSKDNRAMSLYVCHDFEQRVDRGDALTLVRTI
jgi:ribosomal protein S18 acetylase RimI-like enzyme